MCPRWVKSGKWGESENMDVLAKADNARAGQGRSSIAARRLFWGAMTEGPIVDDLRS